MTHNLKTALQAFRAELKDSYGLTRRDVSVRLEKYSMGRTVHVSPISEKSLAFYARIREGAMRFQNTRICAQTGSLLSGGNTFVDFGLALDTDIHDRIYTLSEKLSAVLKASGFVTIDRTGVTLRAEQLEGSFHGQHRVSADGVQWSVNVHSGGAAAATLAQLFIIGPSALERGIGETTTRRLELAALYNAFGITEDVPSDVTETAEQEMIRDPKGASKMLGIEIPAVDPQDETDANVIEFRRSNLETVERAEETGDLQSWGEIDAACNGERWSPGAVTFDEEDRVELQHILRVRGTSSARDKIEAAVHELREVAGLRPLAN